ncbi:MerR family transcriptional regulator [Fundicoccus sp. Sow4_F4]|uniref:MerR family transcriptional regulator n=1 Tax=Fundicoccus sp. Sow4_F4 TaxID=3438783 RepID=UPI003F8F3FE7
MKTSDIEQKYAVSREALRYYIERGLLNPTCINDSFEWEEKDEVTLQSVLQLRTMGLTIDSIVELKQDHQDSVGLKTKLLRRVEKVKQEIEAIDSEQRELAYRKQILETALHQLSQQIRLYEESD